MIRNDNRKNKKLHENGRTGSMLGQIYYDEAAKSKKNLYVTVKIVKQGNNLTLSQKWINKWKKIEI